MDLRGDLLSDRAPPLSKSWLIDILTFIVAIIYI